MITRTYGPDPGKGARDGELLPEESLRVESRHGDTVYVFGSVTRNGNVKDGWFC